MSEATSEEMDYYEHGTRLGDADLTCALHYNGDAGLRPCEVSRVALTLAGENDGANWHWIVELAGGGWAYVEGGCDYTGWDCQSHCYAHRAASLAGALLEVPEAQRAVFGEMLASGETTRQSRSDW